MRSVMCLYVSGFCASIEQLRDEALAGKPVVVTQVYGSVESVVSASPEAAKEGVREHMTRRHAMHYCPDGVFLSADWDYYNTVWERVLDILAGYTPLLEPCGAGRAYLDLGGSAALFGPPMTMACGMVRRIRSETGLYARAGIAGSKLASCAAAARCRPGTCLKVQEGSEARLLSILPVGSLPGVGEKTERRLKTLGVRTVGDLASIPEEMLSRQFGGAGARFRRLATGVDFDPVLPAYPPDTITEEHAFAPDGDAPCEPAEVERHLFCMCESLSSRLASCRRRCGRVTLTLSFAEGTVVSASHTPKAPISAAHDLHLAAARTLREQMHGEDVAAVKITLGSLSFEQGVQLGLLGGPQMRAGIPMLFKTLQHRFGPKALMYCRALGTEEMRC